MSRVLVAGASGLAGRHVYRLLADHALQPVALLRRADPAFPTAHIADLTKPETLVGCCNGVETVISSAGASLSLSWTGSRREYFHVDWIGNRNLLKEAKRGGVRKFVYVAVQRMSRPSESGYVHFHERFVDDLRSSGLNYTVVRPTGFFGFVATAFEGARKGRAVVIGPGTARTNPIHEADVARACIDAISHSETEIAVGGPDVLTRGQIAQLALSVAGQKRSPLLVPEWSMRAILPAFRILHPRLFDLMKFAIEVSVNDCVAPRYGTEHLADYLRKAWSSP